MLKKLPSNLKLILKKNIYIYDHNSWFCESVPVKTKLPDVDTQNQQLCSRKVISKYPRWNQNKAVDFVCKKLLKQILQTKHDGKFPNFHKKAHLHKSFTTVKKMDKTNDINSNFKREPEVGRVSLIFERVLSLLHIL